MNFRTELHPTPAAYKLTQASKLVTVGSCFSDVIGSQLEKYKVETLTNPFGTLFNPLSACKLLQVCAGADVELADSFVQHNGRWYSYDFHSSYSAENEEELYEMLDEAIVKTRRFLKKADVLVLTLGTANVFRLNITGETVANCHKIPANNFTRETLLPEEIITAVAETQSLLRELNPNLKLVLTVSPVRHLKDTLELNSVSKSVLRLATHFLTESLTDISYFPAYELLIDDLRDYRFYKEDLLHPTPLAETYIWEKFTGAYFENTFHLFTQEWDKIIRAKAHKPFHPESVQHQAFIQDMLEKLRLLQDKTDVTEELAYFESQVILLSEPEEEPDSEDEEMEEETIPGYFSETIETEAAEEPAQAALNEPAGATLPEEGVIRKKKKKPRKKKKRPALETEGTALTEVGTAQPSEVPVPAELPSEPSAELAEILAEPNHEIAHYGETITETPLLKPRSKSAKRRDSRRKKKILAATENAASASITEEQSTSQIPETTQPEPVSTTENAMVYEAKTAEPTPETTERPKRNNVKKPAAKKDQKKKNAFPDLFVTETIPEPTPGQVTKVPAEATTEVKDLEELPETPTVSVSEPKARSRKPKTKPETPVKRAPKKVTEKIAVPFVPAATLDEVSAETDEKVIVKKARVPRKPKPVPAVSEAKTGTPGNPESNPSKKPAKKPKAPKDASAAKPGRKKNVTAEQ